MCVWRCLWRPGVSDFPGVALVVNCTVVNCPVWSGRRASTLTEPPLQASPPTFKAKVWRMLKLNWQEFWEPFHSSGFWLRGSVPSALLLFSTIAGFYPVRQNPRSASNFQSNLADALRRPGSHFWNCCLCSWCCVTEKNPGCSLWIKPRAQLASTSETCSFKLSRELALISREEWLGILQTWWHG